MAVTGVALALGVWQQCCASLRWPAFYVVVSLLLKAAFLVMAVTGSATLWTAVLADTGASVIVVANALRLLRTK